MTNLKLEVIKYAKKLNDTNLSPIRSGNVSVRTDLSGKEGFFITPSGIKYDDPLLKIDWPIKPKVISKKDLSWSSLENDIKNLEKLN